MKKMVFGLIIGLMSLAGVVSMPVNAGVEDFHFSDFTGDYYLSKDGEGISHLQVVEKMTAEFPDFNQNKGICRQIPFTNQNGANLTLPNLTRADIKVTRNGAEEPIYSIEKEDNYYNVCTGTDDYVRGTQVYVFEYEFTRVVTEFNEKGREWQELYWDTNGNGWRQSFDKVTARLHFVDKSVWTGESWCYVGKYGASGQDRCIVSATDDGVKFEAKNLTKFENLTLDVELLPGSFVVPGLVKNYTYVWLTVVLGAVAILVMGWGLKKFVKSREKARYYKGIFVKPEYQPNKEYSLPEMAEIYLGKKKDMKVAMILDLTVKHKIEFQKAEKRKWNIIVKDLEGVSDEYMDLLAILNGGDKPGAGDTVELKSRSASSRLMALKKTMENKVVGDLKKDKLVEDKYKFGSSSGRGMSNVIVTSIVMVPVMVMLGIMLLKLVYEVLGLDRTYGQIMVFGRGFYLAALVIIVVATVVTVALNDAAEKYLGHTKAGLEASKYMEGLKLYIKMAEAERMKMLQSVKGADTSAEGIVKLYEKLLPYAAVFGLEESWLNEMKEYCKVREVEEPDYLMMGLTASQLSRTMRSAATYATTATTMRSSGGGASSGFSGGGGGGFSGGGGGGGGGGGR